MRVLGQGIKTGVYRVCDEVFPRLALQPGFSPLAAGDSSRLDGQGRKYLTEKGLDWPWVKNAVHKPSREADVLLTSFFAPWEPWRSDTGVLKAFVAYDLIGLLMPEYFDQEMVRLLQQIYASIDRETLVFCISHNTRKDLLAYRPDLSPEQIVVIPLAAGERFYPCADDARLSAVRGKYGIPPDVPYILSLATLEIRKNLQTVVRAFARLLEKEPDSSAHLVLSGMKGWKLEELDKTLAGMGSLRKRIILTGFIDDADLGALYSGAACFAYMSMYEGFGLPPLEAMACGVPVIASNTSSLPEVVGDAGILLEPEDADAVCDAMRRILADPVRREKLRGSGLERARLFNWDECARIMAEAIRRRLAEKPKLSIITICRNETNIEDTCRSVAGQSWRNFEWIVVDGGSTDGTMDVLERYREYMRVLVSEKDDGRYDAMNKGITHARGEYLLFLNGGDYLAHERVLERIFEYRPLPGLEEHTTLYFDADILYGEVLAKETGMMPWPIWAVGPQRFDAAFFSRHSLPHQATFIARRLFDRCGLYDASLRFAADYEWFMRVILVHGATTQYIPMPVSVYNFEGVSSSAAEGDSPHILEIGAVYAKFRAMRLPAAASPAVSAQSDLPPVGQKWYSRLPEGLKRPLRPLWRAVRKKNS